MTDYFSKPTGGITFSIPEKTENKIPNTPVGSKNRSNSNFDAVRKEMQAVAGSFKTAKSVVTVKRYGIK